MDDFSTCSNCGSEEFLHKNSVWDEDEDGKLYLTMFAILGMVKANIFSELKMDII